MANKDIKKSIVEQIIDITFQKMERSGKYSQQTINNLRKIAKEGNLNRREPIIEALKSQLEEYDETT